MGLEIRASPRPHWAMLVCSEQETGTERATAVRHSSHFWTPGQLPFTRLSPELHNRLVKVAKAMGAPP